MKIKKKTAFVNLEEQDVCFFILTNKTALIYITYRKESGKGNNI